MIRVPLFGLAALLTLAALGTQGCGDSHETATPTAAGPARQVVETPPMVGTLPTATPQPTLVTEEVSRPFNPHKDCPRIVSKSGTSGAQTSTATPGDRPGAEGITAPDPLDAIVRVNQYRPDEGSERTHIASGVVLSEARYVATVLDFSQPLGCPEVVLRNGTALPARVFSLHQMSGAAILEVGDGSIRPGPTISRDDMYSQTAVQIYHNTSDGSLSVFDGVATAADGETLWVLALGIEPGDGDIVLDSDGSLVGVVVPHDRWRGAMSVSYSGGPPRPDGYDGLSGLSLAVRGSALARLSQGAPDDDLLTTPVKVHFGGPSSGWSSIGGDRIAIGKKMTGFLRTLDEPAAIEGLGGTIGSIVFGMDRPNQGAHLELLYPVSQPLEASDGTLVASGRYLMLIWGRGTGSPDLILAGPDPDHVTHAFEADGLEDLWSFAQGPRGSSFVPFQTYSNAGFPSEYPLRWSLGSDRGTYSPGEIVRISLRVENVSVLPIKVQLPSPFRVESSAGSHEWEAEFVSDREIEAIPPGGVLILTTDWDQTDRQGRQVRAGTYHVSSTSYSAGSGVYATGAAFKIAE